MVGFDENLLKELEAEQKQNTAQPEREIRIQIDRISNTKFFYYDIDHKIYDIDALNPTDKDRIKKVFLDLNQDIKSESKIEMNRASIIYVKKGVPVKAGSVNNFAELERLAEKMKDYILREMN